jgi:CHRD domain
MRLVRRLAFLLGFVLLVPPLVGAQGAKFEATLSGKQQAPPIDTPAHGTATFALSKSGESLTYRLWVADVDGVSMAHIHIGP